MSLLDGRLYLRKGELIVGKRVKASKSNLEPQDALIFQNRLRFTVEKTDTSEANKAKISIYNLSPDSRSFIEDEDDLIVFLRVGYVGSIATAFFGDVVRGETSREGPDILTTIECGDQEKLLQTAHIELGIGPGATNIQLFNLAAEKLGITLGVISGLTEIVYSNGYSFSGQASKLLDVLTKQLNVKWSIQDGELMVLPKEKAESEFAVLVTPNSGLVGNPTKTKDGIQFKSLLNPGIRPGKAVKLESKEIQGAFKGDAKKIASSAVKDSSIILISSKVTHEGDTHEGSWLTTVEGIIPGANKK